MKLYISIFIFLVVLTGCTHTKQVPVYNEPEIATETDEFIPDLDSDIGTPEQEIYTTKTSQGNMISINNFGEKVSIGSPLVLEGMVSSNWIFEGIFSINIYTLEGELIKEAYGEANIFDAEGNIIEGEVPFTAHIEFETLPEKYEGKIRFASSLPSETEGETEGEADLVEIMVLFE